jgi:regulation of enolase protein 1 (concanavalin A-like superfamily)
MISPVLEPRSGRWRVCACCTLLCCLSMILAIDATFAQAPHRALPRKSRAQNPDATCPNPVSCSSVPSLPAASTPWVDRDIGRLRIRGGSATAGDIIAVAGGGVGVRGADDQLHFTYQSIAGDFELVARLRDIDSAHRLASAGIMLRLSTDSDARFVALMRNAAGALTFSQRLGEGWSSSSSAVERTAGSSWLRLDRRASLVSMSVSADGVQWTFVGNEVIEEQDVLIGLAVSSHLPTTLATAFFDSVVIDESAQPLPSVSTPGPAREPKPTPQEVERVPPPMGPTQEPAPTTVESAPAVLLPEPLPITEPLPADQPLSASEPLPGAPDGTRVLVFEPSPDHDVNVERYELEVALPGLLQSIRLRQNLGKPAVVGGECRIDVTGLLALLPTGTYVASVKAINGSGASAAATSAPFAL